MPFGRASIDRRAADQVGTIISRVAITAIGRMLAPVRSWANRTDNCATTGGYVTSPRGVGRQQPVVLTRSRPAAGTSALVPQAFASAGGSRGGHTVAVSDFVGRVTMVANAPTRRAPVAARRVGYLIAAALTAGCWYVLNASPGWRELPFLTDDLGDVLGLVNLSLAVGLVANLVYLAYDSPWWRATGELVTTGIGLVVLVRLWQVFPFRATGSFDWPALIRITLILAIAGSIVGLVVNAVALLRGVSHPDRPTNVRRYRP
jgi:hypothetical protein